MKSLKNPHVAAFAAPIAKWLFLCFIGFLWFTAMLNLIQMFGICFCEVLTNGMEDAALRTTLVGAVLPCILFIVIMVSVLSVVFMRYIYGKADSLKNTVRAELTPDEAPDKKE